MSRAPFIFPGLPGPSTGDASARFGGGPLTLVNPFTNDDLTLEQQKIAANQMATSQGANPPFPELQQPPSQDSVEEVARRTAAGLQQLVDDEILTERSRQNIVLGATKDVQMDTNQQRDAAADIRALRNQQKRFTARQTSLALEDIESDHPDANFTKIPGWRALRDKGGEYQQQIGVLKEARAKLLNVGVDRIVWDQEAGKAILDPGLADDIATIARERELESKPRREAAAVRLKALIGGRPQRRDFNDNFGRHDKVAFDKATVAYIEQIDKFAFEVLGDLLSPEAREQLREDIPLRPPAALTAPIAQPSTPVKPLTLQNEGKPVTEQQAQAIVDGDPSKEGVYIMLDGTPRVVEANR